MDKDLQSIFASLLDYPDFFAEGVQDRNVWKVNERELSSIARDLRDPLARFSAACLVFSAGSIAATPEILEALRQALIESREPDEIQVLIEAVGACGIKATRSPGLLETLARTMIVGTSGVRKTAASTLTLLPWHEQLPYLEYKAVQEALLQVAGDIASGPSAARWALTAIVPIHHQPEVQKALVQIASQWPEGSEVHAEAQGLLLITPSVWQRVRAHMRARTLAPMAGNMGTDDSYLPTGEVTTTQILGEFKIDYLQEDGVFWARIMTNPDDLHHVLRYNIIGKRSRAGLTIISDDSDVSQPAGYVSLHSVEERLDSLELISASDLSVEDMPSLREVLVSPSTRLLAEGLDTWEQWLRYLPQHLETSLIQALEASPGS